MSPPGGYMTTKMPALTSSRSSSPASWVLARRQEWPRHDLAFRRRAASVPHRTVSTGQGRATFSWKPPPHHLIRWWALQRAERAIRMYRSHLEIMVDLYTNVVMWCLVMWHIMGWKGECCGDSYREWLHHFRTRTFLDLPSQFKRYYFSELLDLVIQDDNWCLHQCTMSVQLVYMCNLCWWKIWHFIC